MDRYIHLRILQLALKQRQLAIALTFSHRQFAIALSLSLRREVERRLGALRRPLERLLARSPVAGVSAADAIWGIVNDALGAAFWTRPALRGYFGEASRRACERLDVLPVPQGTDRPEHVVLFRVGFLAPGATDMGFLHRLAAAGSWTARSYLLSARPRLPARPAAAPSSA